MVDKKPCTQEKCTFKKGSQFQHMCPICDECRCKQHMIDEDCVNCYNCLKDEGFIRSGKPSGGNKDMEARPQEEEMIVKR